EDRWPHLESVPNSSPLVRLDVPAEEDDGCDHEDNHQNDPPADQRVRDVDHDLSRQGELAAEALEKFLKDRNDEHHHHGHDHRDHADDDDRISHRPPDLPVELHLLLEVLRDALQHEVDAPTDLT